MITLNFSMAMMMCSGSKLRFPLAALAPVPPPSFPPPPLPAPLALAAMPMALLARCIWKQKNKEKKGVTFF